MKKGVKKSKVELKQEQKKIVQEVFWEAPEFEYRPKDILWYGGSFVLMLVLGALAVWQGNFLFAVFLVIAWAVIVGMANQKPASWRFTLTEEGISLVSIENDEVERFHAYRDLQGFDIHEADEQYKELVVRFKSRFKPYLKARFSQEEEEKIKTALAAVIPQEEYGESVADSLSKMVGF